MSSISMVLPMVPLKKLPFFIMFKISMKLKMGS